MPESLSKRSTTSSTRRSTFAKACPTRVRPWTCTSTMATNIRSIQQKLFRSEAQGPQNISDSPKPDNPLTISIPKPATPPSTLPPKAGKPIPESKGSPAQDEQAPRSYRDRLRQRLGSTYKTVEQYRLDQDGKRERHWKRWGPYVSDRQWVVSHYRRLRPLRSPSLSATVREDH